ncbi:MAG: chromate transporter [Synechococcaceae cyanobacterium SM2_3_60]|nr:chromate transporter [Synechococcaceae cyanobacterium SM2_3_60]
MTGALILMLYRVNVVLVLLLAGLLGIGRSRLPSLAVMVPWPLLATVGEPLSLAAVWDWGRLGAYFWPLFSFFFKTGSFIFGGGLVIIPFIETEVVEQLRWLTPQEFLDGVAIGQLSPGPVVLTSAFIGYKVAGVPGAFVAALAIFLPSFIFVGLGTPLLQAIKQQPLIKAFLQGVLPAVLGVIAATTIHLAQSAWLQPSLAQTLGTIAITAVSWVAIVRFRVPTWQLVLGGMIAGLGLSRLA